MSTRPVLRALVLATIASLAFAGLASADNARADGEDDAGIQPIAELEPVAPGATVEAVITFVLTCTNTSTMGHLEPGQSIGLSYSTGIAPLDGEIVSVTPGSTAVATAGWPVDGEACPSPAPSIVGGTASTVTLKAPTTPGTGYLFSLMFARRLTPTGTADGGALNGVTAISIELDVVANTPPVLDVPGDATVEGDTVGGWTADWSGVTAADAEDDPDPTPVCSPAAGEVLPLGATVVTCSVIDGGGVSDEGTFTVTVVDTTPPVIGTGADVAVTTSDAGGAAVTFATPSASDVVDRAPTVGCAPASGSSFPVGPTTVTCTARDASGNTATSSFVVDVTYVPVHTATATWGEPVGAGTGVFVANRGRTLPVKATLAIDGVVRITGSAGLRVVPCEGGAGVDLPLAYSGGRWNAALDTSTLGGWCHTVTAHIDGLDAGAFQLDLRGSEPAATTKGRTR